MYYGRHGPVLHRNMLHPSSWYVSWTGVAQKYAVSLITVRVNTALQFIIIFILTYMVIMFVNFSPLWHIILKMTFVLPSTTTSFISPGSTS